MANYMQPGDPPATTLAVVAAPIIGSLVLINTIIPGSAYSQPGTSNPLPLPPGALIGGPLGISKNGPFG